MQTDDAPPVSGPELVAAAGIHTLTLPTSFPVGPVNSYLIEDDPLTLVDAGPNSATTLEALEAGLKALGHTVEELELILVTHQHLDHTGLVGVLARKSGAEVAALDVLKPWLADYAASVKHDDLYMREILRTHGLPDQIRSVVQSIGRRSRGWGAAVEVTMPLADGEQLRLRDRTLTVRHRPGHSPSDTVFFDEARGIMITGDHLIGHISSNPLITRPLSGDREARPQALVTYMESLRETAADPIELALPGHGKLVQGHRQLIEARFVEYGERRDHLHRLIEERPRSAYELAVELWGDEAARQATLTISEVLGHVDLLLNTGDVVEQRDADGVVRFFAT